jgi:hypothetical protein
VPSGFRVRAERARYGLLPSCGAVLLLKTGSKSSISIILRMETVINYPKEFSVYRTRHHHAGTSSVGYYPMTKSVASLVDYHAWVDASRSSQADHGSDCLGAQPYGSLGCLLNSKAQQRPDFMHGHG